MKYVYAFDEGNKDMRELLGGKGANLAEMTKIGLPPDGTRNVMPRREHDRCTCRTAPF